MSTPRTARREPWRSRQRRSGRRSSRRRCSARTAEPLPPRRDRVGRVGVRRRRRRRAARPRRRGGRGAARRRPPGAAARRCPRRRPPTIARPARPAPRVRLDRMLRGEHDILAPGVVRAVCGSAACSCRGSCCRCCCSAAAASPSSTWWCARRRRTCPLARRRGARARRARRPSAAEDPGRAAPPAAGDRRQRGDGRRTLVGAFAERAVTWAVAPQLRQVVAALDPTWLPRLVAELSALAFDPTVRADPPRDHRPRRVPRRDAPRVRRVGRRFWLSCCISGCVDATVRTRKSCCAATPTTSHALEVVGRALAGVRPLCVNGFPRSCHGESTVDVAKP